MGSVYQLNAALYLYLHHFLFRMNSLISTEWNLSKKNCIASQIIYSTPDFCFPNTICPWSQNWRLIFLGKTIFKKASNDTNLFNEEFLNVCFHKKVKCYDCIFFSFQGEHFKNSWKRTDKCVYALQSN